MSPALKVVGWIGLAITIGLLIATTAPPELARGGPCLVGETWDPKTQTCRPAGSAEEFAPLAGFLVGLLVLIGIGVFAAKGDQ